MFKFILTKLWEKLTSFPDYNKENKQPLTRFIADWPVTSFFLFNLFKVLIFPSKTTSIICSNLPSLFLKTTATVLTFHGILHEYTPKSTFSDILQGIIVGTISSSQSYGVLHTFMSISRRKNPLYIIWIHNLLLTAVAYKICLNNSMN